MEHTIENIIDIFKEICSKATSEDDIKGACNIFFYNVGQLFELNIEAKNEKTSVHGGRIDSIYNNIYFEYKKLDLFAKADGVNEAVYGRKNSKDHGLFHYLVNFSLEQSRGQQSTFEECLLHNVGVGFDGKRFVFCRFKKSDAKMCLVTDKTKIFPKSIPNELYVNFEISDIYDFENGVKLILLYIRSTKKRMLCASSLCESFSNRSEITRTTIPYLYSILEASLANNTRIATLYKEWNRIFGVIYEKQETDFVKYATVIRTMYRIETQGKELDVKKVLFVIQTYYSIIIKLLIQNLFISLRLPQMQTYVLKDKSDLIGLFHGNKDDFNSYIDNFFEIHFFEWFTLVHDFNLAYINAIIREINQFETTASVIKPEIVGDVLKLTYESIMPKELRHLMGEYYTVEWLADFTIEKSGYAYGQHESVLDPTCGSGIFLTHLIKKYKEKYEKAQSYDTLVNNIICNFVGFDINPIAVIQCKGNYILSLGDITKLKHAISVPVYMCDSILVPTVHAKQKEGGRHVVIETSVGSFNLPLLKDRQKNDILLKLLSVCILNDYTTYEQFVGRLKSEYGMELDEEICAVTRTLFNQLLDLHLSGKDGFWPIILKNSFAPLFCKQQFDYIIGNPPWIAWKAMSESYRQLTLDIWLSYGIFEKNAYDKITSHDDFAMAVTYVAIDHYLKPYGTASLILPQTFVKSLKGGEGFRKFCITRDKQEVPFCISTVYDMLSVNPFKGIASNKTSVYIFKKSVKMTYPMDNYLECYVNSGENISTVQNYSEVSRKLGFLRKSAKPINENVRSPWLTLDVELMHHLDRYLGSSPYQGRKGIEPCGAKGVYLINVLDERNGKVKISNLINRSRLESAKRKGTHIGFVDKDFVYPMVGGRNIDRWGINSNTFMLVPHYCTGGGIYRGVPENDLKTKYYSTYDWLFYFHDLLLETRIRSAKFFNPAQFPWYRLDNVGEYTFASCKVLWQEQSKSMNCCVVSTIENEFLGSKTVVTDSKVLSVSFENELEAHYLCAVLNSSIVEKIVQGYTINTNRGIDVVKNINVPAFDANNPLHLKLADMSKEAHNLFLKNERRNILEVEKQINEIIPFLFEKS